MAAFKTVGLLYFLLLCSGFCHGGRFLSDDAKMGSEDHAGTGMMNGDRSSDSGGASPDDFRFRGIIGGWDGIPTIEVPAFEIPFIGFPGFGIPSFSVPSFEIGGGIDIDFGGSDDPELGRNGGGGTKPGDGGSHDEPKLLPDNPIDGGATNPGDGGSHDEPKLLHDNPIDGGDSFMSGRYNGYDVDDHEAWTKNKMKEMMGNAMAPKDSEYD